MDSWFLAHACQGAGVVGLSCTPKLCCCWLLSMSTTAIASTPAVAAVAGNSVGMLVLFWWPDCWDCHWQLSCEYVWRRVATHKLSAHVVCADSCCHSGGVLIAVVTARLTYDHTAVWCLLQACIYCVMIQYRDNFGTTYVLQHHRCLQCLSTP